MPDILQAASINVGQRLRKVERNWSNVEPKSCDHYENKPILIYWKFYHQKMKIYSKKEMDFFFLFLLKT